MRHVKGRVAHPHERRRSHPFNLRVYALDREVRRPVAYEPEKPAFGKNQKLVAHGRKRSYRIRVRRADFRMAALNVHRRLHGAPVFNRAAAARELRPVEPARIIGIARGEQPSAEHRKIHRPFIALPVFAAKERRRLSVVLDDAIVFAAYQQVVRAAYLCLLTCEFPRHIAFIFIYLRPAITLFRVYGVSRHYDELVASRVRKNVHSVYFARPRHGYVDVLDIALGDAETAVRRVHVARIGRIRRRKRIFIGRLVYALERVY